MFYSSAISECARGCDELHSLVAVQVSDTTGAEQGSAAGYIKYTGKERVPNRVGSIKNPARRQDFRYVLYEFVFSF